MDYYASGKLMLFGEYLVLRGSECVAIPLKFGQKLKTAVNEIHLYNWTSTVNDEIVFSASFSNTLETETTTDEKKAATIQLILKAIKEEKPDLFNQGFNFHIDSHFPLEWGFGSSSTLISCLAQWSEIDPFLLLRKTLGGSGYDVACATASSPIIYKKGEQPVPVYLFPKVTSKLLFVYSGKKQPTGNEVRNFNSVNISEDQIERMTSIVYNSIKSTQIEAFENCINESEALLSSILDRKPLKESSFQNYPYSVKSLGAWGGDFFFSNFQKRIRSKRIF
jgi:mevalonate kinase